MNMNIFANTKSSLMCSLRGPWVTFPKAPPIPNDSLEAEREFERERPRHCIESLSLSACVESSGVGGALGNVTQARAP